MNSPIWPKNQTHPRFYGVEFLVLMSHLQLDHGDGTSVKVLSERLEERGIEPATPRLQD